ncbi:MAG: glycosyltransferase family 2 protein [Bacteroidetes bacterium]|nr:glycosyltransferase family 2 protein [Bacteroidota bacterium]
MTNKNPYISIVSPVYMAEGIVDELVKRIKVEISKITDNYEIILVEDGSPDQSWEKIEENCNAEKRVKGIKLSRNFGQHYAITAGLQESNGDYVVVMDCDLQDNPKYIVDLLNKAKEGFDIVYTVKKVRKHGIIKNFFAGCFHKVYNWLANDKRMSSYDKIGAFSLISRKVVEAFCDYNEFHRAYLPVLRWLGFSNAIIPIEHEKRYLGKTSYSFSKSITLALDGIVSHSNKLLLVSIYIGFVFAMLGFISIIYIVIKSYKFGFQPGWASTTVLIVFCTGLIMISLGIIGVYIGKIFLQSKGRPLYLIDKKLN